MTPATMRTPQHQRVVQACIDCPLQARCFLANPIPHEQGRCAAVVRRRYPVARGERLYRRNAPFSSLFQVCGGSIKTQRETPDGGLVVTGFFLAGDIVGVDAVGDNQYPSDAIATAQTEVCQLDVERLLAHCTGNPELHAWVISRLGFYMRRKDSDLSWSTGLQSHQRVLRFFLDLHERLAEASSSSALALPMRKQDIARYLHITPETLSRNLAQLRRDGLLRLDNDRFMLPDTARARQVTQL